MIHFKACLLSTRSLKMLNFDTTGGYFTLVSISVCSDMFTAKAFLKLVYPVTVKSTLLSSRALSISVVSKYLINL